MRGSRLSLTPLVSLALSFLLLQNALSQFVSGLTGTHIALLTLVVAAVIFVLRSGSNGGKKAAAVASVALKEAEYQPFKLIQRTQISSNTVIFRFALASSTQRVGLPVGKHMLLKFTNAEGKPISRPYTPISSDDDLGYFDLLIKLYPQGQMSQHLDKMQIGESIEVRGPQGSLHYTGSGAFTIARRGGVVQRAQVSNVGMIAGGSGITPMFQVLKAVHKQSADRTKLSLLFANVTEADILMKDQLDTLREQRSLTNIVYTLDRPAESWTGPRGFVTPELIQANLPAPAADTIILLCGPKPMVDGMEKHLIGLGYTEDMIFKF